jgi:hypothetical protein
MNTATVFEQFLGNFRSENESVLAKPNPLIHHAERFKSLPHGQTNPVHKLTNEPGARLLVSPVSPYRTTTRAATLVPGEKKQEALLAVLCQPYFECV